jgi:diguanylate cyclase (GGDEF)-like protein
VSQDPTPERVLIVDPDATEAAVVRQYLEDDGFAVEIASSAEAALTALAERPADVVIIDVYGADMPGEVFIAEARAAAPWVAGPGIIVLSARDDADNAVVCLHAGADDYIVKPLARDRLVRALHRVMERRLVTRETQRLRRDLSLFAAGQRLLETLDERQLAVRGLSALTSFAGADAAALLGAGGAVQTRGLDPDEEVGLGSARLPPEKTGAVAPSSISPQLSRFAHGLLLDVGDGRRALLLRRDGDEQDFSRADEQNALFLARHLAMGLRNVSRYAQAEQRARRDPLTGVLNGHAFAETLKHALVRAGLEERQHAVLFCDIDRFKTVNDSHGHLVGSQVLIEFATRLMRCVRETDVVGRYGGDEFVVLLTDVDKAMAMTAAERIRRSIGARAFLARGGGPNIPVTACIGVALFPDQAKDARALLDLADRAMYLGKAHGRDAVHLAEPGGEA